MLEFVFVVFGESSNLEGAATIASSKVPQFQIVPNNQIRNEHAINIYHMFLRYPQTPILLLQSGRQNLAILKVAIGNIKINYCKVKLFLKKKNYKFHVHSMNGSGV